MNSKFENIVNRTFNLLTEAGAPQPPASPTASTTDVGGAESSALPGGGPSGGGMPSMPSGPEGAGAGSTSPDQMDNKAKRDADPLAYTQGILSTLVDKQEGVSPEMFDAFVDNASFAATKIKDKEGFKRFYKTFYDRVQNMLETKEELKDMYKQLQASVGDLLSQPEEPDSAGGGKGMSGPAGPGVK